MNPNRTEIRREHASPAVTACLGWRYHHLGIPTTEPRPGERYLKDLKMHVSGFETSPFGIEWMRFDADCPIHTLIQTVPHIAFEVDDLEKALQGRSLLGEISSPMAGIRAAMIVDNGAPVELIEFCHPGKSSVRPVGTDWDK